MPKILNYILNASLNSRLLLVTKQPFFHLIAESPLQKIQYSKKHFKYCLKVLKSSLYKLKSIQKTSKAVDLNYTRLLYSIFQVRSRSFFNPNPTL